MSWVSHTGTYTDSPSGFVRLTSRLRQYANGNYGTPSTDTEDFNFSITEIPANAVVSSATVRYRLASPRNGYVMTCNGTAVEGGIYNAYTTTNIRSLFKDTDTNTYTNVAGSFALRFTFRASYSDGYPDGSTSEQVVSNLTITVNYTYQTWEDDTPSQTSYTGTASAKTANFQMRSSWTRYANGTDSTPTTDTVTKTFKITGIPSGATVTSALLYVTCKNSICGPQTLTCKLGGTTKKLTKNFDNVLNWTSQITGNGTYTFTFTFKEYGGCLLTTGSHYGVMQFENVSLEVTYIYVAEEEADPAEAEADDYIVTIGTSESTGICLYSADVTDFTDNGYGLLHPTRCTVSEEAGGMYEAEMELPIDASSGPWEYIATGAICKIPVPVVTLDADELSGAARWRIRADYSGAPVKSRVPTIVKVSNVSSLAAWASGTRYKTGDKVKHNNRAWQYIGYTWKSADGNTTGATTSAPGNVWYWQDVTSTAAKANDGETLEILASKAVFIKIMDINSTWMRVQTAAGTVGYLEKKYAQYYAALPADVPTRTIRSQCFRIYRVEKDSASRMLTVNMRHISYDFNNTILGKCEATGLTAVKAIKMIKEACVAEDNRQIFTNITEGTVDLECSWDNGTAALINPDTGIVPQLQARLVRDNHDFFIFEDTHEDNGYMITYGKNLKSVRWSIDTSNMVTRVIPHCRDANDNDLLVAKQAVDSKKLKNYPTIFVESMEVNCKVGEKGTLNGQDIESMTTANCRTLMTQEANKRFDIDHADEPEVEIDIDLVELRTTEEYKQFEGVERLYMYDSVQITHPLMALKTKAYMTGYTYDAILKRYETVKLTSSNRRFVENVSGFRLRNNSIKFEKLSSAAVRRLKS